MKAVVIVGKEVSEEILLYYTNQKIAGNLFFLSPYISDSLRERYPNIIFYEDADIFLRSSYPKIEQTSRPNWYFQQLLKYKIVDFLGKKDYDWVHIIDGDSFVRNEIILDESLYFTPKKIEHQYMNFIRRAGIKSEEDKNFITNQMLYCVKYLQEMLSEISTNGDWVDCILELINEDKKNWFSEYQIYACFVKERYQIPEKPMKIFRRLDLLSTGKEKVLKKYAVVSYEYAHGNSFLHKLRANIYYLLGKNLG